MFPRSTAWLYVFCLAVWITPALAADELIRNGDFEQGNKDIGTQYKYSPGDIGGDLTYDIVKNPSTVHGQAKSFGDHTTGKGFMMAINGGNAVDKVLWSQAVDVQQNADHGFSLWLTSWYPSAPAEIDIHINAKSIGKIVAPNQPGQWKQFTARWNSGNAKVAKVELFNLTRSTSGNDFAIDDISLQGPGPLQTETLKKALADHEEKLRKLNEDFAKGVNTLKAEYAKELDKARKHALTVENLVDARRLVEEKHRVLMSGPVLAPGVDELIRNGDFDQGNKEFQSKLSYSSENVYQTSTYSIAKNSRDAHRDATPFADHTSGKGQMLMFNGGAGKAFNAAVWAQTVEVRPQTEYTFSFWLASWFEFPGAELEVQINGKFIGKATAPSKTGEWKEFKVLWNSTQEKSAAIEIINRKQSTLAIDDISLRGPSLKMEFQSDAGKKAQSNFATEIGKLNEDLGKKLETIKMHFIKDLDKARIEALEKDDLDEAQRLLAEKQKVQNEIVQLKPALSFEILYAKVGVGDQWDDATKDMRKHITNGSIRVNPAKDKVVWSFPDRNPGVPKSIIIVYAFNGVVHLSVTREDQDILLPAGK